MTKFVKMLAAAAVMTVAVGASSQAQDEKKKGTRPQGGGQFQGRGMGMMGGGTSVYGQLATNKDLIAELKITDDQKKKLEEVSKAQREKMMEAFRGAAGGNPAERTDEQRKEAAEKMTKFTEESKKAYAEVLNKEQVARVTQIGYQASGVQAFSEKAVQEGLKMTDEQKEKIKTVNEQLTKDRREVMGAGGRAAGGGGRPSEEDMKKIQENMKKAQALSKEAEEKVVAVLTDDQKKLWKDMIGEKFDITKLQQGFGGRTRQDS